MYHAMRITWEAADAGHAGGLGPCAPSAARSSSPSSQYPRLGQLFVVLGTFNVERNQQLTSNCTPGALVCFHLRTILAHCRTLFIIFYVQCSAYILKGPVHSKNENLYFLALARIKWMQQILSVMRSNVTEQFAKNHRSIKIGCIRLVWAGAKIINFPFCYAQAL